MKAAQINEYGSAEVLTTVNNAPKPSAGEGQVVVEVQAAGMNPFDWKVREGMARQMAELNFPATLGGDFAGIIAEVGEGVTSVTVGDEVYGQANALGGQGSYAEFTVTKAEQVAPKPRSVDFLNAAALPLAGVSAYQVLVDHMDLQANQKVLIHGGAGGIGSLAIQIAKQLGAHVAATAATDDLDFVKGLGADEVIDYKTQDFSTMLQDYDAAFDTVGGETYTKSFLVLKSGGVVVSMVEQPNEPLMKQYGVKAISQFTQVTTERLAALAKLVDEGAVKVTIDKVFSLDEASAGLAYLQAGQHRGKVVLKVKD